MSDTLDRKIRQLPAFYDNISNLVRYDVTFGRNDQAGSWSARSDTPADGLSLSVSLSLSLSDSSPSLCRVVDVVAELLLSLRDAARC